jgi:hypothetical protein
VVLLSLNVYAGGRAEPEISVNAGPYGPFYQMRFDLTAAVIDFDQSDREASSGGQFEFRLRPEQFPIPAPRCRGSLILRMPWTAPNGPQAEAKIVAKKALLARIWKLGRNPSSSIPVELELNPYVEVISRSPFRLQLTECNVFFRQSLGAYIDYSGPLH